MSLTKSLFLGEQKEKQFPLLCIQIEIYTVMQEKYFNLPLPPSIDFGLTISIFLCFPENRLVAQLMT